MKLILRCDACDRVIWPWQHFAALTRHDGKRVVWHVNCGKDLFR